MENCTLNSTLLEDVDPISVSCTPYQSKKRMRESFTLCEEDVEGQVQDMTLNLVQAFASMSHKNQARMSRMSVPELAILLDYCAHNIEGIMNWSASLRTDHAVTSALSIARRDMEAKLEAQLNTNLSEIRRDARAEIMETVLSRLPASEQTREGAMLLKQQGMEAEKRALEAEKRVLEAETRVFIEKASALQAQLGAQATAAREKIEAQTAAATAKQDAERALFAVRLENEKTRILGETRLSGERMLADTKLTADRALSEARREIDELTIDARHLRSALGDEKLAAQKARDDLQKAREDKVVALNNSSKLGIDGETDVNAVIIAAVGAAAVLSVTRSAPGEADATLRFENAAAALPISLLDAHSCPPSTLFCDSKADDAMTTSTTSTQLDIPHAASFLGGDIVLKIETKNRDEVRSDQVSKFERELTASSAHGGVFVSTKCAVSGCVSGILDIKRLSDGRPVVIVNQLFALVGEKRVSYMKEVLKIALDMAKLSFFCADLFLAQEEGFKDKVMDLQQELCDVQVARFAAQLIDKTLDRRYKAALAKLEALRQNVAAARATAVRTGTAAKEAALNQAHAAVIKDVLDVFGVDSRAVRAKMLGNTTTQLTLGDNVPLVNTSPSLC